MLVSILVFVNYNNPAPIFHYLDKQTRLQFRLVFNTSFDQFLPLIITNYECTGNVKEETLSMFLLWGDSVICSFKQPCDQQSCPY